MSKKHSLRLRARGIIAALVMTVGVLAVILRVGYLSLFRGEELRYKAERRQLSDSVITAGRGAIYDANMKVLAQSASTWLVYAVPSMIKDDKDGGKTAEEKIEILVANLGEILGVDEKELRKGLSNQDSGYYKVKGQVEKEAKEKVVAFRSEYDFQEVIGIDEDSKRYYPYSSFASSVIGFVNADGVGSGGVEQEYNGVLTGVEGRRITSKNGRNETIGADYETVYEAQQGVGVVLTIDETIQYYLEEALNQAIIDHNAMNAYGIVMDVQTGAILAMSTSPGYDLNDPRTISNPKLIDELLEDETDEETDEDEETAEEKTTEKETTAAEENEENKENKTAEQLTASQQKKIKENEHYLDALFAQWRNRVVSDTYEPGSVFKTYVLSAALEEGVVDENMTYTCVGGIQVADHFIKCWKTSGHGHETLAQGLMNSCNPFFITIGQKMGAETFYKYFEAFGFTEKTGIDLPGEVSPKAGVTYHTLEGLNLPELSSSSFGQTFQISPIQMITGISCIANGGKLMKPYVVAKTVDNEGNTISETKPVVRRQVISEKTSKQVASIMEEVVSHGTGKNAYVPGYRVAGKTGTSEKLTNDGKYIASFSGFAPADNPKIAVLVAIDEPEGEHGGGAIAAPIVGSIFEKTLVYLNVEPQYTDEELSKITKTAPSVVGKTVSAAQNEISSAGFTVKVIGNGDTVLSQMPSPNSSLPADGVVVVYTEQDAQAVTAQVPSLTGMTISQANRAAVNAGFNIKIIGATYNNGEVVSYRQSLEEGTQAEIGSVITVYFKSSVNVVDG